MKVFLKYILIIFVVFISTSCKKNAYKKNGFQEVKEFGDNPGNLKMFYYEPEIITDNMPLVVALHGCSQNAKSMNKLTGWNDLADEYGFIVLYPEQKTINNVSECFNWFNKNDYTKDSGENKSIFNMIDYMIQSKNIDKKQIHVVGLSAGGLMTSIICSVYPDLINSGTVMSGGPYKPIKNATQSMKAMRGKVKKTGEEWGDLVREENPNYVGKYPKMCVIHGKKDYVSDYNNVEELVKQWVNITNVGTDIDKIIEEFDGAEDVVLKIYKDDLGNDVVLKYEIANMAHALSVDPGDDVDQGGKKGILGKDKNFFSTYWTAKFFGLIP